MGYLAKSREVLQINDLNKLHKLLAEQRAEILKHKVSFGRKKSGDMKVKASVSGFRKTKKNIARILTRINQLKQKEMMP